MIFAGGRKYVSLQKHSKLTIFRLSDMATNSLVSIYEISKEEIIRIQISARYF